jgi:hypothetical protein
VNPDSSPARARSLVSINFSFIVRRLHAYSW